MDTDEAKKNEIDNLLDDFGSDDESDTPPTSLPEASLSGDSDWNSEDDPTTLTTAPEESEDATSGVAESEPGQEAPVVDPPTASEDPTAEEAQEVKEEDEPPKKKARRATGDVLPASPPPPSEDDDTPTYQVQRGFTIEGRTYHRGDVIPVKCKFCALWEKEWGGKVRCAPGRMFADGEVMRAEKYSCQSFFIAKEMEPELNTLLTMTPLEVATVRRMLPGMKRLLSCEPWLNAEIEKKELVVDSAQVFESAKGFVTSFTTIEQMQLSEEFIRQYVRITLRQQKDKKKKKRIKFEPGDWVEWTDAKTGLQQKGIILRRGRGNIVLAGLDGPNQGVTLTFKDKEWRKSSDPQITRKAANLSD